MVSFGKVFTGLLVPVGDVAEVVAEHVTVTLGEGIVVRVLSWVKDAFQVSSWHHQISLCFVKT